MNGRKNSTGYCLEILCDNSPDESSSYLGPYRKVGKAMMIDLLWEARDGLEFSWRVTPVVRIGTKWYVEDEHAMQLRNIKDPQDRIDVAKV